MFVLAALLSCASSAPDPGPAPVGGPGARSHGRGPGPGGGGHPGAPPPSSPPEPADPSTFTVTGAGGPNVLWVTIDTVSAGHLAPYGGRVPVPTLESLGGVRVAQAYSNFPETALSHWSFFTGVLPEVHGNVPGNGQSRYAGPSIAELARARGYATAAFIGGVTLVDASCGLSRGFDRYDDALPAGADHRPAAEIVQLATGWIAEQKGPWFVWVHLFDAHLPYTPADATRFDPDYAGTIDGTEAKLAPYRESRGAPPARDLAHVEALYDAEIAEMDAALAPLVAGLHGDEVVVVNADHGESFAHGYLFNHRAVLWDDVLHVPLWVKAPGLTAGAADGLFSLVDLAPTVAELAGWSVTAPFMGASRVGLLRGGGGGATVHHARTDPWLPPSPGEPGPRFAVRTATEKRIREADGSACTYDLRTDPGEVHGACVAADDAGFAAYTAAIESMARYRRPEAARGAPGMPTGEMLEKLGYVDHPVPPAGGAGAPPAGRRPPPPPPSSAPPSSPPTR